MSFKETEVGRIPKEWNIDFIDNLKANKKNAIAMGPFGSNIKKENFIKEGVPVIRGNNLNNFKICEDEFIYLTEEKADKLKSSEVNRGDIVITHRGTLGQVSYVPYNSIYKKYIVSQSGMKLSCDVEKVNPIFLTYFLKSRIGQYLLLRNTSQVGVPSIATPTTSLKKIPIPVPPLEEQKAIAKILSDLDDKIEVNNKINKNLEDMAQAIFKHWFVDFEFPNEEGKPYKSSGGEMVESELGMIPKGWEVKNLNELCDIQKGLSYKGKYMGDNGIPMINLGNINPGGGYRKEKIKFYNGDYKDRHSVSPGDIVIANTDMTQDRVILGSPMIVPKFNTQDIIFTHHLFAFRELKIEKTFLYYYLKSSSFRERAESYATGTTVLALSKDAVINIEIPLPSKKLREMYEKITDSIFKKIDSMNNEIDRLSNLRDTLLPKLMSGEIRVPID